MNINVLLLVGTLSLSQASFAQMYNVYTQGPNYVGGSYVAPVSVKTYNISSGYSSDNNKSYSPSSYSTYTSYSSGNVSSTGNVGSSGWSKMSRGEKKVARFLAQLKAQELETEKYNSVEEAAVASFNSGDYVHADSILSSINISYPPGGSINFILWYRTNYLRVMLSLYKGDFAKTKSYYEAHFIYEPYNNGHWGSKIFFCEDPTNQTMLTNRQGLSLFEQFELDAAYTTALCHAGSKTDAFAYWNKAFTYFYPRLMASASSDDKIRSFEMLASVFLECDKPEKSMEFYTRIVNSSEDKNAIRQKLCDNMVTRECLNYHPDKVLRQYLFNQLDTLEAAYGAVREQEKLQQVYFMKAQLFLLQNEFQKSIDYSQKLNLNKQYEVYGRPLHS